MRNSFIIAVIVLSVIVFAPKISEQQELQRIKAQPIIMLDTYKIEHTYIINEKPIAGITPLLETAILNIDDLPKYNFTDYEKDLLARLIDSEAGIENLECKIAVGSVVINRMYSDEFPDTIEDVIYQRKPCVQFSVILKNSNGIAPIDIEPSEESIEAVDYIIKNGKTLPDDVMVFYADYLDSGWVTTRTKYTKIDSTYFSYLY